MGVADNIKELRKSIHMTQKELAQETGLSIGTIQGYEHGKYEPKLNALTLLKDVLGCSYDDILDKPLYDSQHSYLNWLFDDNIPDEEYEKIITLYNCLNKLGRKKADEQVEMLTKIPEYQRKNNAPEQE